MEVECVITADDICKTNKILQELQSPQAISINFYHKHDKKKIIQKIKIMG